MTTEADATLLAAGGKGDVGFGDKFAYEVDMSICFRPKRR
jgi:hypothetical protein